MEEIAAGKHTSATTEVLSPRKVYNPIGTSSQWSFGWQANDRALYNKENSSKGKYDFMKGLIVITIKAVSSSMMEDKLSSKKQKNKPC